LVIIPVTWLCRFPFHDPYGVFFADQVKDAPPQTQSSR
jgi:hypothetical protein